MSPSLKSWRGVQINPPPPGRVGYSDIPEEEGLTSISMYTNRLKVITDVFSGGRLSLASVNLTMVETTREEGLVRMVEEDNRDTDKGEELDDCF